MNHAAHHRREHDAPKTGSRVQQGLQGAIVRGNLVERLPSVSQIIESRGIAVCETLISYGIR
jgi:hypothetical protein